MKRITLLVLLMLAMNLNTMAQEKLYCKNGMVHFFSIAPLENIEAQNNKLLCIWLPATGQIEFSVLMKGFVFKKALMQAHFNEDYVESDKYPKAGFKGTISGISHLDFKIDKEYPVLATGVFTLHGVSRNMSLPARIVVKNGVASASADFNLLLEDYKIKIPALVKDNINKQVHISVTIPAFIPFTK